ncbi:glycerol kinase GlpK [Catenisphaera adipataccumulans]|uniref:Glycerol kinase n=1 Tax=Catenisphaera adipataccumulans TaxID=700500 RepID=A0A7W8CWV2_9FIRM|nr:glycerol kinase GlpK [Catenisphaera adipataccumulans]MBB5182806.1 glycerol kinase [Catenisphaera adipataccumulans]
MNQKQYVLAIDSGTTSTRAVLFDHGCQIVGIAQQEGTLFYPYPGWVEQDAEEVWDLTVKVIHEVLAKCDVKPSQVAAIGISNQRETSVIWDKKTGKPIYHALVWQSKQTTDVCRSWASYNDMVHKKTGLRVDPYFSASKISWLLDHVEGARQRAENGDLLFGTIDTWLVWKLSGGKTHITDVSNASRTLLYNIHACQWDDELLKTFNIPAMLLPEVKATSEVYTMTDPDLLDGRSIPIGAVVGDQQAALFGQGCFVEGMVKNTFGTGGFMLMNTGQDIVDSKSGLLSTIAWKLGDRLYYALEGSIFVSGSTMKWLRDQLGLYESTKITEQWANDVEDTAGVYFVPAFVGLGAPYWNDTCKAEISGLTLGANKKHIVRAALESMAYQSKDVLDAMVKDSGIPIKNLKVDGGASANNFLLQFLSDLLRCEVERYKIQELTSLGAAFLAGMAVDYWHIEDFIIESDRVFVPKAPQEQMDAYYAGWQRAVRRCMQE